MLRVPRIVLNNLLQVQLTHNSVPRLLRNALRMHKIVLMLLHKKLQKLKIKQKVTNKDQLRLYNRLWLRDRALYVPNNRPMLQQTRLALQDWQLNRLLLLLLLLNKMPISLLWEQLTLRTALNRAQRMQLLLS